MLGQTPCRAALENPDLAPSPTPQGSCGHAEDSTAHCGRWAWVCPSLARPHPRPRPQHKAWRSSVQFTLHCLHHSRVQIQGSSPHIPQFCTSDTQAPGVEGGHLLLLSAWSLFPSHEELLRPTKQPPFLATVSGSGMDTNPGKANESWEFFLEL